MTERWEVRVGLSTVAARYDCADEAEARQCYADVLLAQGDGHLVERVELVKVTELVLSAVGGPPIDGFDTVPLPLPRLVMSLDDDGEPPIGFRMGMGTAGFADDPDPREEDDHA